MTIASGGQQPDVKFLPGEAGAVLPLQPWGDFESREGTLPQAQDPSPFPLFGKARMKALATVAMKAGQVTVSRFSTRETDAGFSSVLPAEDAYLVAIQLGDAVGSELWKQGRMVSTVPFLAGSIIISHLREEPRLNFREPFDVLALHIPEAVFRELADERGGPMISALRSEFRANDFTLHHAARAMLTALENPLHPASAFLAYMVFAVCFQLAQHYGVRRAGAAAPAGMLNKDQLRLAKDMLTADLTEYPSLEQVARMCAMPVGRFMRAFRETTGAPPHRWLRAIRVERAKELLRSSSLSLAQIAYECGFSDQSHFTRVFSAATLTTPASWRRAQFA